MKRKDDFPIKGLAFAATAMLLAFTWLDSGVAGWGICPAADAAEGVAKPEAPAIKSIATLIPRQGGRVDWCHKLNLIAFDRRGKDGCYDVYTMKPDGSDIKSLTENNPDLPKRNVGQPAWHPSGRHLVLQVEKAEHKGGLFGGLAANPGAGAFNDLWVLDIAANRAWPLVELPDDGKHGVLHPHFSADGTKLSWAQMYSGTNVFKKGQEFGLWSEKVADFLVGPKGPALSNVREFRPLGAGWYENHGFSPDGKKLIFTCNAHLQGQATDRRTDIVTLDLENNQTAILTDRGYNEHALFSPNGRWIVWMSDVGIDGGVNEGTEYWIMKADGSSKQRLTSFNQSGHANRARAKVICADFSWGPDDRQIAAYHHSLLRGPEVIRLIGLQGMGD